MIAVVVMTDGRRDCIRQAVPSLTLLEGLVTRRIIHDDSGDATYRKWLARTWPSWEIIHTGARQGFAGAYRSVRAWLAENTVEPYVFSTEDDFVIQRRIDLHRLAWVLTSHPYLLQLVAKRQAWNPQEKAAGGIMEQHPTEYVECRSAAITWCEHRLFWSTNPHLAHRDTLKAEWPDGANSEGRFTHQLLRDGFGDVQGEDVRFGFIGGKDDPPLALHVGDTRNGTGY